jgi:hypothetical protein
MATVHVWGALTNEDKLPIQPADRFNINSMRTLCHHFTVKYEVPGVAGSQDFSVRNDPIVKGDVILNIHRRARRAVANRLRVRAGEVTVTGLYLG